MSALNTTLSPTVEALYTEHHDWLLSWLRRRLGNAADAADLAHDAFLRLLLNSLTFTANWTHTGSRAVNASNTAVTPGYDLFGIGLRHHLRVAEHDTTLRFGVDNLFNKRHWANVSNDFLVAGAPRTVWASMSVKF